ncbi:MAG: LLM class flavin-dependent oxidoreductase [Chloroflexi bacterium]|nr:LLM class flavin-dependent oxidoreductase [Chloroflexota bacterium]
MLSSDIQLSVVDQSPVRKGGTARDALTETVELARAVEQLGYRRFWVAEHHNLANFAGTSPEILIGQIAASTQSIRVGSGGVMLPHYSAFKVAEVFRMLETLFPGRIDLGIGRAPGSDQITAAALSYPRPQLDVRHYPIVVRDLLNFLHDTVDDEHPFASLHAGPGKFTTPEVWLLGSRADSAAMAAEMGLPFSFAHFFGLATEHGPAIAEMYRQNFQPSEYLSEPKVNVALQVLCAETDEDAQRIGASRNLSRVRSVQNIREGVPPIEEALAYEYRPDEWAYLSKLKESYIDGTPEYVRDKIEALADIYDTNDIGIVTICYSFADRVRSYALVAEAFDMTPPATDTP